MITVENLSKVYRMPIKSKIPVFGMLARDYKNSIALKSVDFTIQENELVGFIGPNGAGKTTTMKIMAGILYPSGGEVRVLGYKPFDKRPEFLKQIAFIMGQKNQMLWELPALDSFRLNKEIYEIDEVTYKKRIHELIDLLDAAKFVEQPVKTLSLGQRMRVELISALLHHPKVLFLDEPTIGLDIFAQTTIVNFIKEYQQRYKATIVLTSHYMQDVQRLAQRVIMINSGAIIYDGLLSKLVTQYSHAKTVHITLEKELKAPLALPKVIRQSYQFPRLTLTIPRDELSAHLPEVLNTVDFSDLTVEEEPIEEIIKKLYLKKNKQQ